MIERRLMDVSERLRTLRAELAESDAQARFFEDEADDARLRALVSETPLADHESREARHHADTLRRHRDALARSIAQLEEERDALLDRLASELAER